MLLQNIGSTEDSIAHSSDQRQLNQSKPQQDASQHPERPKEHQTPSRSQRKANGFLQSLSDSRYLDSTGLKFENRRLLLNCDNNLHIVDGVSHRYYIGIIDFFTLFQCRQHVGKFFKDIRTCCGNHSTEPPDVYAKRFYQFIMDKTV